jgi:hypothetical protein
MRSASSFQFLLSFWLAVFSAHALGQTLVAATDLKEGQSPDSKTVKSLAANTPVKLLKREGFWVEVEAAGLKGWVKLSTVNMGTSSPGLNPMDTGRSGKGNIVSTSAARGLSAKDLTLAKPDPVQFAELQKLAVSSAEAEAFAKSGELHTRKIALITATPQSSDSAKPKPATAKKPKKSDDDDDDD